MSTHGNQRGASVVPTVRYRDVPAAIAWLCRALGLEEHRVVAGENGTVRYAELTYGNGMVMVAPIEETAFGKLMVQPHEIGGVETQICYLFVEDANTHCARAKAAGAEIVLDIEDQANGGRGYSCRDPEGHVWNFGTYDPWESQTVGARRGGQHPPGEQRAMTALLLSLVLAAGLTYWPAQNALSDLPAAVPIKAAYAADSLLAEKAREQGTSEAADGVLRETRDQLAKERLAKAAADRTAKEVYEQMLHERRSREAAERAVDELRARQALAHNPAVQAAKRAAAEALAQLAEARSAQERADRAAAEARSQLVQAREAKEAAEATAKEARDHAARERRARIAYGRLAGRGRRVLRYFRRSSPQWSDLYNMNPISYRDRSPPFSLPRAPEHDA